MLESSEAAKPVTREDKNAEDGDLRLETGMKDLRPET